MFDTQALRKAVETTLATATPLQLPEGHTKAVLIVVNQDRAQVVFAMKKNDIWDISGQVGKAWKEPGLEAGVTIRASW